MIVPCKSEASFLHVYHLPGIDLKVWDFLKSWLYMGPLPSLKLALLLHKVGLVPRLMSTTVEWTNLFEPRNKVVYLIKLGFQSGVRFLIRCIFEHAQCPLVDF